jgi:hypothetical protein
VRSLHSDDFECQPGPGDECRPRFDASASLSFTIGHSMSRRSSMILAAALAIVLTVLGWQQVMIYKTPSKTRLVLWFPFIVLLRASDLSAVMVSIIQFPTLAIVYVFGVRRWSAGRTLIALVALYAMCAGAAFLIVRLL